MLVKKLSEFGQLPTKATDQDAAYDLYAAEDVFIPVGQTKRVRLGIAIEIDPVQLYPNINAVPFLKVEDRSSMASKGIRSGGGVVDAGYRGELQVVLHNLNNVEASDPVLFNRGFQVKKGDRIAQGIIQLSFTQPVSLTDELTNTDRGTGGFGSTGV